MSNFGIFACCSFLLIFIVITFTACFVIRNRREDNIKDNINRREDIIIRTPEVTIQTDTVWWVYEFDLRENASRNSVAIILHSENDVFFIGRQSNCNLCLLVDYAGRYHAYIKRKGNVFTYYDSGSYIGSVCNGKKIKKIRIRNHTKILIYQTLLYFSNRKLNRDEIESVINGVSVI